MRSTPPLVSRDYSKLIGIPYVECNCFDLAKKFYSEILGKDLKHYYDCVPERRSDVQNLIYTSKGDFDQVEVPEFGDIVLIKIEGLESHIAIFVGNNMILHTLKTTGMSVVDRLNRWNRVVTGFYRLREDND